jgi:hypothetical protein
MTTSTKVQIPSLVSTMPTCWWKEWNVVEGSVCSCFHPTWKSPSFAITTKVPWITSWVFMCSLPWVQRKRWTLVALMGCVHIHRGIFAIERCGNPSRVRNVVKKDGEDNWKAWKTGWVISQMLTLRLEHDKIRTWWVLDILLKNILEKVWWCKWSEMESWNWTICYLMSYSKGSTYIHVRGNRKSQTILRCCWKGKVLLLICFSVSRKKGRWSTINLTTMMEATRA